MNFILEMAVYFWKLETYIIFTKGSLTDNCLWRIIFKKKKKEIHTASTQMDELTFN